jgi:hypothetical protein
MRVGVAKEVGVVVRQITASRTRLNFRFPPLAVLN